VPPDWRPAAFARAMIAWNGTAQSSRALGYAIPLLRRVPDVTVLSVGVEGVRAPTEPAIDYLARHGVRARSATFDAGTGSARARGRTLLGHVMAAGADLMVMGAFGDGGVLSFLGLGGATGKIITASKVPVLIAR
jgi:nucleotide-binding universal stress UspA family protein